MRRLYRTERWKRTRLFVIRRDRRCLVNGPDCNGRAESAHHTTPSSQLTSVEAFFDVRTIVASCMPCSQHGPQVRTENRDLRFAVARLEQENEDLRLELLAAVARLAEYEPPEPRKLGPPAIR
jgi:hypothetical protein